MEPIVRPYPSGAMPGATGSMLPNFVPQQPGESPEAYAMRIADLRRQQALPPTPSPGPHPALGVDLGQGVQPPGAPMGPSPSLGQDLMAPGVQAPGAYAAGVQPNPSLGQSLDDPMAVAKVGPPTTPEERQGRLQSWVNRFDQIKNDPQAMMMLLKFGTEMIQPVAPGQTPLGHTGRALQGSVDYLGQLQSAEALRTKTQAEAGRTQAETEQTRAETGAIPGQMERTAADTERIKATTPTAEERKLGVDKGRRELEKLQKEIMELETKIREIPADSAARRKLLESQSKYYDAYSLFRKTQGTGAGKVPAAVANRADLERRIRSVTPREANEKQMDYDSRIQKKVLEASTVHENQRQRERREYISNGVIFEGREASELAVEYDLNHPPLISDMPGPSKKPGDPAPAKDMSGKPTLKFDKDGNPVK